MSRLATAAVARASVDPAKAIEMLDALLPERERQAASVANLSGQVHRARASFEEVEAAERRAVGAEGFANAVAATQAARDDLAAAARDLSPAQAALRELDRRIAAAWRIVLDATRPGHLAAEAAAEADLRAAAAQVGHAVRRLNDVRRALGSAPYPRQIIKDPANADVNAANVDPSADGAGNVPFLEDITRLRLEIEIVRGR